MISDKSCTSSVSVKRRLRTADCRPVVKCRLSVKCRQSVKCRLQSKRKTQAGVKCRIKTVDFFKRLCSFFFKSVK